MKMYEKSCRKHNSLYIVFYLSIYSSVFQHFHAKSANYTEKQPVLRENGRNHCVFSLKRLKTNHLAAFTRIFCMFHSVFAEISLRGNDNGRISQHLVAGLSTHNRHQREKQFVSRNTPRHPLFHRVFIKHPFFDSNKKF